MRFSGFPRSAWGGRRTIGGKSIQHMKEKSSKTVKDGAQCKVVGGVHAGKSGVVRDLKTGKTGFVSITVVQKDGERFKTLAKNVVVI